MSNVINYAKGLLDELEGAVRAKAKELQAAVRAELERIAPEVRAALPQAAAEAGAEVRSLAGLATSEHPAVAELRQIAAGLDKVLGDQGSAAVPPAAPETAVPPAK